jgi:hypothetical protein
LKCLQKGGGSAAEKVDLDDIVCIFTCVFLYTSQGTSFFTRQNNLKKKFPEKIRGERNSKSKSEIEKKLVSRYLFFSFDHLGAIKANNRAVIKRKFFKLKRENFNSIQLVSF